VSVLDGMRAAIKRVGWSETARRSGVDRVTLHRVFGEGGNPKLSTIEKVAPHVGVAITIGEAAHG
jgi:DNA-binding phage protein